MQIIGSTMQIPKQEVKKSQNMYDSFGQSRQTFPKIGMLEAINGNIVLRGRRGRRDQIYPLLLAAQRFSKWFSIWRRWQKNGFHTQNQELKLVLIEFGAKIQQAIAQRLGGHAEPPPEQIGPKFMADLAEALKVLKI